VFPCFNIFDGEPFKPVYVWSPQVFLVNLKLFDGLTVETDLNESIIYQDIVLSQHHPNAPLNIENPTNK
jgi:hypothetical protein